MQDTGEKVFLSLGIFSAFLAARQSVATGELQAALSIAGRGWRGEDWILIQENGKMMSYSTPYGIFQDAIRRYNDGRAPEQQLP
ncbi:MAG: hypothetical protein ACLR1P_08340 [Oscillospiraceae bacterium]